jgi:hypothetical protein
MENRRVFLQCENSKNKTKPKKGGEIMAIGDLFKTGEISSAHAKYAFDHYTDGTTSPSPTEEEKEIELDSGDTFPPINSCDKGAWWKMEKYIH